MNRTANLQMNSDKNRGVLTYGASFYPTIPGEGDCPIPKVQTPIVKIPEAITDAAEKPKEVELNKVDTIEKADTTEKHKDYTKYKAGVLQVNVISAEKFIKKLDITGAIVLNKNDYDPVEVLPLVKNTDAPEWNQCKSYFMIFFDVNRWRTLCQGNGICYS